MRYIDNSMRVILQPCCQYSAHPQVYAVSNVVPDIYTVNTVPHIQASIFNWTYLHWYWRYDDNSMGLILQPWCQIQRISSSLRYPNRGPGHIQCNYSTAYSVFNIQLHLPALLLDIRRHLDARYTANLAPNTAPAIHFTLCELVVPHIYNVVTAPHIQPSIFSRKYLRCNWRYLDYTLLVKLQSWCPI
jgi:hypothetical protein